MAATNTERTVLVAVDASPNARNAFDWYMSQIYRPTDMVIVCHASEPPRLPSFKPIKRYLANVYRGTDLVIVCHVPEPPDLPLFSLKDGLNIPVEEWKNVLEEQMSKVQKLEKDYEADLLSKRATYKMNCSEQDKNPGQAIIRLAEAEHADMIVMGTRGLDALRRTLLGSVSDYVVRHSSVPVVICPLPKK